jgi:hypothetical protein
MPSRDVSRKKSTLDRSERPSEASAGQELPAEQRIAQLEAELTAARARITELESARDQVLDRIAWVVDSLHNGIEK